LLDNMEDGAEPLLFVDVNLGDVQERITVMEGDTADSLTQEFGDRHKLDANMRNKLRTLLQQQIDGILEKIEEEDHSSQITGEGSDNHQHYEEAPQQPEEQKQVHQEE